MVASDDDPFLQLTQNDHSWQQQEQDRTVL